jgi:hypothetical protein
MMTDTKGGHEDLPSKLAVFPDMMISQGSRVQRKARESRWFTLMPECSQE